MDLYTKINLTSSLFIIVGLLIESEIKKGDGERLRYWLGYSIFVVALSWVIWALFWIWSN